MLTNNRKDQGIETLRGLAIVLMVSGHVIGGDAESGLTVADDSAFRYIYYSLQFLRMPLFTVISGYVYSLRPARAGHYFDFLKGKCRRILLPLVFVSTLQYLARVLGTDVNRPLELSGIWRIYIYPFDHFWFLHAIFLVFVFVAVLDVNGLMNSFWQWLTVSLVTILATQLLPPLTGLLGFNGFQYLLPYFLLGCGLARFENRFTGSKLTACLVAMFVACVVVQQLAWFLDWKIVLHRSGLLALCIGMTSCILLVAHRFANAGLARLGYYSYGIYLFHVFGTAGSRIVLNRIGITSDVIVFFVSTLAGLAFPILLEAQVLSRVPLLQYLLLGVRAKPVPRIDEPIVTHIE